MQLSAPSGVPAGASATIVATFTPAPNSDPNTVLAWSLSGPGCSGSSCGVLSITTTQSTGSGSVANSVTYTAPATAPGPNTVTATVTPQADPSKKAQATIAIQPGISVSVSPATDTLAANHRVTLTTQVNGTRNTIHPRPRVNDADRRDRKNDVMRFCTGVHCGPLPHGRRYRPVWFPRRTLVSPKRTRPGP